MYTATEPGVSTFHSALEAWQEGDADTEDRSTKEAFSKY
jgi:hypothetical protein